MVLHHGVFEGELQLSFHLGAFGNRLLHLNFHRAQNWPEDHILCFLHLTKKEYSCDETTDDHHSNRGIYI